MVELTDQEEINTAKDFQEQGNTAYKDKRYADAAQFFTKAVDNCKIEKCM